MSSLKQHGARAASFPRRETRKHGDLSRRFVRRSIIAARQEQNELYAHKTAMLFLPGFLGYIL